MSDENTTLNDLVRAHMRAHEYATVAEVRAACPGVDPLKASNALERLARLGDVRKVGLIDGYRSDGLPKKVTQYKYIKDSSRAPGPLAHAKNKTLLDVQPRATRAQRSKTIVQRKPSGYAPGHFTALARAESDALPTGFPPCFDWDGSRKLTESLPIAKLQTILRRELDSASGKGWGGGTSVMPGTPMQARPSFMGRIPGAAA